MAKKQSQRKPIGVRPGGLARLMGGALCLLALALSSVGAWAQSPQSIKVAAVDFVPAWGDLDGNVRHLAEAAERAGEEEINYAVFPETAVSGYLFSDPTQIAPYLDTIPGKTTAALLPILARHKMYLSVGDATVVVPTALGRIGLASADELAVPELGGLYGVLRSDLLAVPAGEPQDLKVEIDAKLFGVPDPPTGRADFFPFAAAKQNQLWLVSGGRREGGSTAAAIYGPEPVVSTPTLTAAEGDDFVGYDTVIPAPGTWINQSQLIAGQQAQWFVPLVLPDGNGCLKRWRAAGSATMPCL